MSHFECHLNGRFWRSKKVVKLVQIGGRGGGGGEIGQNPKEQLLFFCEIFPKLGISSPQTNNVLLFIRVKMGNHFLGGYVKMIVR